MSSQSLYKPVPRGAPDFKVSRKMMVAGTLMIALFAFEIFNFDTTEYALASLLGEASFVGLKWASILAVAFCAIDFAGLARIFTPEKGWDEPKEVWYLMGAWLLGATMNAVMTWWAVSLTLLNHPSFGNEVLSRDQLLTYVPIFVAVLVWLTRILFIGALSVAGDHLFDLGRDTTPHRHRQQVQQPAMQTAQIRPTSQPQHRRRPVAPSVLAEQPTLIQQPSEHPQQPRNNNRPRRSTKRRVTPTTPRTTVRPAMSMAPNNRRDH